MTRPDCFDFAMEFLGEPEAPVVRAYVEELEQKRDQLLAALRVARLYLEEGTKAQNMVAGAISSIEQAP